MNRTGHFYTGLHHFCNSPGYCSPTPVKTTSLKNHKEEKPALWPVTLLTPPGLSVHRITRDHRIHYYLLKLLNIFKHQIHQL